LAGRRRNHKLQICLAERAAVEDLFIDIHACALLTENACGTGINCPSLFTGFVGCPYQSAF
jgi:hypothetical protein